MHEFNRNCLGQFMESDLGCTARIYFDNMTLTLHYVTLTSQSCANPIKSVIEIKQTGINEVYEFSIKYRYSRTIEKSLTSFNILLIKLFR